MILGFKKYELWYNAITQQEEERNLELYYGEAVGAVALTRTDMYGMTRQVPHLVIAVDGGGFETIDVKDCFVLKVETVKKPSVEVSMDELEEKIKAFTAAHKGKSGDELLAEMRGEELYHQKAEEYIKECTRTCSNELVAVEDRNGKDVISYHEWITPEQALRAVEIAREEMKKDAVTHGNVGINHN